MDAIVLFWKLKELLIKKYTDTAANKAISLTLLKDNALKADNKVLLFELLKFIKKNEKIPINSQKKKNNIKLFDRSRKSIESANPFNKIKNLFWLMSALL